jgi:hypothetical protein
MPNITTGQQFPQEDTMKPREEYTDDEDEELVIPKTEHRTPHAEEELLAMDHRPPDAQKLVHERFTERNIR